MEISKELYDELCKLMEAKLDERGHELCNPIPKDLAPSLGRPPTLQQQIQRLVRVHLSQQAMNQGMETFEESEDIEPDDEPEIRSEYELMHDEVMAPRNKPVKESKQIDAEIPPSTGAPVGLKPTS